MSAVTHLYGPKFLLAAALVLTLALKLLLYHQESVPEADSEVMGETIAVFLRQHGFESRPEKRFGDVVIRANNGKCNMLIREAAPQGWNRSAFDLWAKSVGRLTYVFDGAVYVHEPFLAPMLAKYWMRVRIKMGHSPNRHPVLAVAASDNCAIDALPWPEFGMLT